jgi:hypothetical protein
MVCQDTEGGDEVKAIYELVTAAELKVGDKVIRLQDGVDRSPRVILGMCSTLLGNVRIRWSIASEENFVPGSPFFRQVPVTEDPRVLRRAIQVGAELWDSEAANDIADAWIKVAQKEIESEAGND